MKTSESVQALRRANPRTRAGSAQLVDASAEAVGAQLATAVADVAMDAGARRSRTGRPQARRRAGVSLAGVMLAAGAAAAVFLTIFRPMVAPVSRTQPLQSRRPRPSLRPPLSGPVPRSSASPTTAEPGREPRFAGTAAIWPSRVTTGSSYASSTARSTGLTPPTAGGSSSVTRRTSTLTAARHRTSTSPPCTRTSAA